MIFMEEQMKKVVIVGGGTGGISSAAKLRRERPDWSISIIEPSENHYYQPLWTLVGAGLTDKEYTRRDTSSLIPTGVKWIKSKVKSFNPDENKIQLINDQILSYDYLIVAAGIQLNWDAVEGLRDAVGKNGVCSNYSLETVDSTFESIKNTKDGNALFTQPNTPIKCGGAPQKIMYLAEEYFREYGLRNKVNVEFMSAGASIFGVEKYRNALQKVVKRKEIKESYQMNLIKIDSANKVATFENLQTKEKVEKSYSMIHVTPPMGAPDFVKNSPLADAGGWVEVDKHTTQHIRFPNVFSLGDVSSLPTGKTGAGIRKQYPILVENLLAYDQNKTLNGKYDGYTSCPLVTGKGKLILAEFNYEGQPVESFPFDQGKERLSMYILKKYILPVLYWFGMMKGRM